MATPEKYLLKGPMPPLKGLSKDKLKQECEMWRNIWQYVPSEVRYYVARVGSMLAVTYRNYHRQIGILLDTHWDIIDVELGVYDKQYDTRDGQYYYERKIVRVNKGALQDLQWIAERTPEQQILEEGTEEEETAGSPETLYK